MRSEVTGDLSGVRPVDDPLWSSQMDRFQEANDAFLQAMSDCEQTARREADRYATDGRLSLAANSRGAADAYKVAQRTARIAFRPFIGGLLADSIIAASTPDVLDEDRCEATDATT